MKKILLLFLLSPFIAHGHGWQWVKEAFGNSDENNSNSVVIDIHGNVYIAGVFNGNYIVFGTDTLYDVTPPSPTIRRDFFW